MTLFKYLPPKYADALINLGSIRIGTLYSFRDQEKLDKERGDKLEGARQYYGPPQIDSSKDDAAAAYLLKTAGITVTGTFQFSNQIGPAFVNEAVSKDCYIYCTTSFFDEGNCSNMGGACIEIIDPLAFFSIVDDELLQRDLILGKHVTAECIYGTKEEDFHQDKPGKTPGWKLKPKTYAHQKEVRTMWVPKKETDLQGTVKSAFYKYVTLDVEQIETGALVGKGHFRRIR